MRSLARFISIQTCLHGFFSLFLFTCLATTLHATPTVTGNAYLTGNGVTLVGYNGAGSIQFNDGDTYTTTSYGDIGYNPGGVGEVDLTGTTTSWTIENGLYVGDTGTSGLLNILGGANVTSTAGSYSNTVAYGTNTTGVINVTGPGSTWNTAGTIIVGASGNGTLNITDGGVVTTSLTGQEGVVIGYNSGSTGTVLVDGAGSQWNITGSLIQGLLGTATITVSNGGSLSTPSLDLSEGTDTVTVKGSGSVLNAGSIELGYYAGAGFATMTVSGGGVVNSAQAVVGNLQGAPGAVVVTGAHSQWNNVGLMIVGYISSSGTITVADGGLFSQSATGSASGTGDGTLTLGGNPLNTAPGTPASVGTLYIGNGSTSGAGILNLAQINGNTTNVAAVSTIIFNDDETGYYFTKNGVAGGTGILISGSTSVQNLAGTVIFTAASTYVGGTTVSGGKMVLANGSNGSATGSGSLTVATGATITGSGTGRTGTSTSSSFTIHGNVIVGNGTDATSSLKLAAGASAPVDGLFSGAHLAFNLAADGSSSNVLDLGATNVKFVNTELILNLIGTGVIPLNASFLLMTDSAGFNAATDGLTEDNGVITGGLSIGEVLGTNASGNSYDLYVSGDNLYVRVAPEPETWALLLGGVCTLLLISRRRHPND